MMITVEREVGLDLRELNFDCSGFEIKDGALLIYKKGSLLAAFANGSWSLVNTVEQQDA